MILTFLEKPTLVLPQYFFMEIQFFQFNLTQTYSIHLLTTYQPSTYQLLTTTFIFLLVFMFLPGIQNFIMPGYCHFYVLCVFCIYYLYRNKTVKMQLLLKISDDNSHNDSKERPYELVGTRPQIQFQHLKVFRGY